MRICTLCGVSKLETAYEAHRTQCKECRKKQRNEAAKKSKKQDPLLAPHVDSCVKCRAAWSPLTFKWRTDVQGGSWRTTCTTCYNEKKYYETYRKKQRETDEQGYLERNNKSMKQWRENNPDKVKALYLKRQADVNSRWGQLITSARQRGKFVCIEDAEILKTKMVEPCFYCGFEAPEEYRLNGLDCVDPNEGYTMENTVSACAVCNMMKCNKSIDAFVNHTRRILSTHRVSGPPTWIPDILKTEKKESKKVMELTATEKKGLHMSECRYCGLFPALGIDRKDSGMHYTLNNVVPCCSECNYTKKDLKPEEFLRHVGHIKFHTRYWVLRPNAPLLSLTEAAEWCYHSFVNNEHHFLTVRPERIPYLQWEKHPATEFHSLFEKYMR